MDAFCKSGRGKRAGFVEGRRRGFSNRYVNMGCVAFNQVVFCEDFCAFDAFEKCFRVLVFDLYSAHKRV